MLASALNVSEGRRRDLVARIAAEAGRELLDTHVDSGHHRSVLTLAGPQAEAAVRAVAGATVAELDLRRHRGAHPRLGVLDVVPFAAVEGLGATLADAVAARDRFAAWAAETLSLPCFLFGPERSLPEIRRSAFSELAPDTGPPRADPRIGATAVGARAPLVAYNVWLAAGVPLERARAVARRLRGEKVRALAFGLPEGVQVSFNLLAPAEVGPADVYDAVRDQVPVARAELVGLVPARALETVAPSRWSELDLRSDRTLEARLAAAGP